MTTEASCRPPGTESPRVLLVDDEPAVVAALRRQLRGRLVVDTATSGPEALELIAMGASQGSGYAVVVSDMQMPGMNGAVLLRRVRERSPRTVRVLLTGQADVHAAVEAINQGWVFRFLWKPCQPDALLGCLQDAVLQHRLITAERELQERTLRASIRALVDTLALANPVAFTRADRIKRRVVGLAEAAGAADGWQMEIASMLAQLGTVSLPPDVVERLHRGAPLDDPQEGLVERLPELALEVIAGIPRLEAVREMIRFQPQRFDGRGPVSDRLAGGAIPLGARLLAVATAYDRLDAQGIAAADALACLRQDPGRFDPEVLDSLEALLSHEQPGRPVANISLADVSPGMILAADVITGGGRLLCGQGQEVTDRVLARLRAEPDVVDRVAIRA